MKKQFLTLALLVFASVAFAQDYKPFKVGIGLGFASPSDGGGGAAVYVEPAYRLSDEIALGLRLESAGLAKVVENEEASISGNASVTVNGQYYLSNNKFRPFVGLGLGIYSIAGIDLTTTDVAISEGNEFGFYPRVGFDFGHLNFIIDYNFIPDTPGTIDINTNPSEIEIKNSYITVKIGASIGGGRN